MLTLIGVNDPSSRSKERLEGLIEKLNPQVVAIGLSKEFLRLYKNEIPRINEYVAHVLRDLNASSQIINYLKSFYGTCLLGPWNKCIDCLKRKLPVHFIDNPSYAKELFDSAIDKFHQMINFIVRNPPSEEDMNALSQEDLDAGIERESQKTCLMDSLIIRNLNPGLVLMSLSGLRPIESEYMADRVADIHRKNKQKHLCCFLEPFQLYDDPLKQTLYSRVRKLNPSRRLVYDPLEDNGNE
ncbi:hypothetical protein HYV49_04460 [Candidatus Pacearchaeota archaeon]|nr:hypothetical protein [Candidatus Pacearchaeota archaeon]